MCETDVYLKKNDGSETLIMKDSASILLKDGGVDIYDIIGKHERIDSAEIESVNFIKHRAIIRNV